MAEEPNVTTEPTVSVNTPTIEELQATIESLKSEGAKNKAALDKALKEKGDLTKSLRAKQTAEEQEAEAKRIADEERQAEYEKAIAELNEIKAKQAYSSLDPKSIDAIIGAVSNGDHNAIAQIIDNEKKAAVKVAQSEWLKSRPQPQAGGYTAMTREQIMAIKDATARQRAIEENIDLFN